MLNFYFFFLNSLIVIFFILNNLYLLLLILLIKGVFIINLESDVDYEFNFLNFDYEIFYTKYLEIDIDDQFLYTLWNQELYLNANCRFFFDLFGGTETLDNIDFIDHFIYRHNNKKNFKHIYSFLTYKSTYKE